MRWNGASHCEFYGKSMETDTTIWSEFPNGGKAIVEQILAWEEINKSKGVGLRVTVWDPSRKVCHLSKVVCDSHERLRLRSYHKRSSSSEILETEKTCASNLHRKNGF